MCAAMALPEQRESQELQVRSVPVPAFLAELGVKFAFDETLNARLVMIPPDVSQRVNVIDPVTSLVQADPNWTPRISVAQLNPDAVSGPHFYKQAGNKLAPTKQALEVLGKAAGILYTRTNRIPRTELDDGEIGYRATLGVRRSDGTVEEISREKVWVGDAERAEIEDAVTRAEEWKDGKPVRGSRKFDSPGTENWNAEVTKRWLKELKDRSAKTESKAVLRAIRAALQIPHTFTPADAAKPFLVIGFNFTPDYNDADTKRALVAAGLNAQASMYGPAAIAAAQDSSGSAVQGRPVTDESQQASDVADSPSTPEATDTDPDVQTETADAEKGGYNHGETDDPTVAAQEAAKLVPPIGVHSEAGSTLAEILEIPKSKSGGPLWFEKALQSDELPDTFKSGVLAFCRVYLPDLYEQSKFDDEVQL